MKFKSLFLFTLTLAILLVSCSSDEPDTPVYEAAMTSFGFYVEDNEGIIVQDYVVSPINQTSISVLLPEDVDKTRLVARFTVSENDVVKVEEVVQQSGVTANDFTGPVDYFVSEGTANVKYTVTVGKAPAYVWTALPPVAEETLSLIMKVSPAGIPYIAYRMDREATDDEALAVMSLKEGTWSSLGQVSEGRADSYFDIAFKSDDLPAVSYLDYTSTISRQASVKSWNGTTWSSLGNTPATTNKVTYHTINYVNDNKLMLFAMYDGRDNVLARRELSVNTFENGIWSNNATIPGRASGLVAYLLVSEKLDNAIYLGVYNAVSPNSVSVYKYENNNWTAIIDKWSDENATGINLRDFAIAVDREGNVFAALVDDSSEGVAKHRVIRYDAETKEISSVGSSIGSASGGLFNFDLAVSPLGVPYLFYRNESFFPSVVSLDKDTQDWTTPIVLESAEADDLSLGFAPDGKAYLVYTKDNKIYSYKYDAPAQ